LSTRTASAASREISSAITFTAVSGSSALRNTSVANGGMTDSSRASSTNASARFICFC